MATIEILSPLPGIFYHRPSPDEPLFKSPGDPVAIGDVIGLVEIMKSFNDVKAECTGTFQRYAVGHGEEIMPGQPLAVVEA
jgi:biotin carboxyl carrier protein